MFLSKKKRRRYEDTCQVPYFYDGVTYDEDSQKAESRKYWLLHHGVQGQAISEKLRHLVDRAWQAEIQTAVAAAAVATVVRSRFGFKRGRRGRQERKVKHPPTPSTGGFNHDISAVNTP